MRDPYARFNIPWATFYVALLFYHSRQEKYKRTILTNHLLSSTETAKQRDGITTLN